MKRNSKAGKVGIIDVAKEAGVSVATVSRVINNKGNVSYETEILVKKAIEKLQFHPNVLGRSLRQQKTNVILILVPSISNPFYSKIVEGIGNAALDCGYYTLLAETNSLKTREKELISILKEQMAAGIIWADPASEDKYVSELSKLYPVFVIAQILNNTVNSISIDNRKAVWDVVDHLYRRNRKRIAFLGNNINLHYNTFRYDAYLEAIKEYGISNYQKAVFPGFDIDAIKESFNSIYNEKDACDSIISISDVQNLYILEEAKANNIIIGKELALIGFDNIGFTHIITPSLSSVDQPRYKFGYDATMNLIDWIEGRNNCTKKIILEHKIISRESTQ